MNRGSGDPQDRRMKFRIEIDGLTRRTQRLLRLVGRCNSGTPIIIVIAELDPAVAGGIARAYGVKVKKIEE